MLGEARPSAGAHFVAALAFLLERALAKKLKAAGSKLSGEAALEALRTIHVVEMEVGPMQLSNPIVKNGLEELRFAPSEPITSHRLLVLPRPGQGQIEWQKKEVRNQRRTDDSLWKLGILLRDPLELECTGGLDDEGNRGATKGGLRL